MMQMEEGPTTNSNVSSEETELLDGAEEEVGEAEVDHDAGGEGEEVAELARRRRARGEDDERAEARREPAERRQQQRCRAAARVSRLGTVAAPHRACVASVSFSEKRRTKKKTKRKKKPISEMCRMMWMQQGSCAR